LLLIVLFYVLFVCVCVLYCCHRVSTQLQLTNIQGEHKVFPWLQIFITRKLLGIQTYFLPLFKLVSKKNFLVWVTFWKKNYICIPSGFLVIREKLYAHSVYLTAIGLTPGSSSTVHIYTQTIHRTAQLTTRTTQLTTEQHN
jgi:hypothetical protein